MSSAYAPTSIQDAPDGPGLLTSSDDGKFMMWDNAAGRMIMATMRASGVAGAVLRTGNGSLQSAPDGPGVMSAGNDDMALLWDNDAGRFVATAVEAAGAVAAHVAAADPHTGYLLATGTRTGATAGAQTFTNAIACPPGAVAKFGYQSVITSVDTSTDVFQAQQLIDAPVGSSATKRIFKIIGEELNPTMSFSGAEFVSAGTFRMNYGMVANYTNTGTNTVVEIIARTDGAGTKAMSTFSAMEMIYRNQATGGTVTRFDYMRITDPSSTGAVTYMTGIKIANQTKGANNKLLQLGSTSDVSGNYGIYNASTYDSYFAGNVGLGGVTAPTAVVHAAASTTARASICKPHGSAPTSPVNGDEWTTASGSFVRINGTTKTYVTVSSPATYTPSNVTTDRTYDANATTLDELADIVGTLIADLKLTGIIL